MGTGRKYHGMIEIRPYSRGLYVINHIRTETYLEGVLNAEISTQWHMDVVKAQAIIARTYALFKRRARNNKWWHLTSGSRDQNYMGANMVDKKGKRAIRETKGIVVHYRGQLAQTFYHSNCGGVTEDPAALWRFSLPYLTDRTASNRAAELAFVGDYGEEFMNASQFRRLAGYDKIQSLLLDVVKTADGFYFEGYGNGHGVGLCQWAAKEMAESGYRYEDILHYFYDGIRIRHHQG